MFVSFKPRRGSKGEFADAFFSQSLNVPPTTSETRYLCLSKPRRGIKARTMVTTVSAHLSTPKEREASQVPNVMNYLCLIAQTCSTLTMKRDRLLLPRHRCHRVHWCSVVSKQCYFFCPYRSTLTGTYSPPSTCHRDF